MNETYELQWEFQLSNIQYCVVILLLGLLNVPFYGVFFQELWALWIFFMLLFQNQGCALQNQLPKQRDF